MTKIEEAPFLRDFSSPHTGRVISIHNQKISQVAKLAGAPFDKRAGVYLHAKVGEQVVKGEPLYSIHAETEEELHFAVDFARANAEAVRVG